MEIKMEQVNGLTLDELIDIAIKMSTITTIASSFIALSVDFVRRRVRAKAAEYAAENDFNRLSNAVTLLQATLDSQVNRTASNHVEMCQRVAHLEGRVDALKDE